MPVGKRVTGKNMTTTSRPSDGSSYSCTMEYSTIKHPDLPNVPYSPTAALLLELILRLVATAVQYLNIYRTFWWLPSSPHPYPLEVELIDPYLLTHILMMEITPCLYYLLRQRFSNTLLTYTTVRIIFGLPLFATWLFVTVYPAFYIDFTSFSTGYRILAFVGLCYVPVTAPILYHHGQCLSLFKRTIYRIRHMFLLRSRQQNVTSSAPVAQSRFSMLKRFVNSFHIFSDWPALNPRSSLFPLRYTTISIRTTLSETQNKTNIVKYDQCQTAYFCVNPDNRSFVLLRHRCLNATAEQIREEAELFRRDFNARLMDILFQTFYTVYYSTVLPVLLISSSTLYYDSIWCAQHVLMTAVISFLLHSHRLLPMDYLNMLHQCSLHLGSWDHCRSRIGQTQSVSWSPVQVYSSGILVRHLRGQFRSNGLNIVAEPGNGHHNRFYTLFSVPDQVAQLLLFLAIIVPGYQLFSLHWTYEWDRLLGIAPLAVISMFNLYWQLRDMVLLCKVYSDPSYPFTDKMEQSGNDS